MTKMRASAAVSRPTWDTLEPFARTHIQGFIQQLLEDEVGFPRFCRHTVYAAIRNPASRSYTAGLR